MQITKKAADTLYGLISEKLRLHEMDLLDLSDEEVEQLIAAKAEIAKGLFGFPTIEAARVAVDAVRRK